jgi:hypothetical protein
MKSTPIFPLLHRDFGFISYSIWRAVTKSLVTYGDRITEPQHGSSSGS